ncbi:MULTISPECIES: sodium-dependent transporter [unclassified Methanoregula]|uniref:sodium-dependent transporter n=1 Tax=unclassified Methanoregula TaxID=2649730 RepID=UPI0009CA1A82|nr:MULTISPECIES: sodium-dependent transporter [unclassified Methanoregula]OPX64883.1 MAG: Sodium:neurotransmitter symporter family protein [Methanoregula sp. PtaB.Bin085]OPY32935.1 MAG: Sodium:neurotransmitter symporter family protein [Methanoregula sp. PtaU1.Bin006]
MERWSSHVAFILAAVGAAVGIGNIWRFPALLGQNGGGAYLIPYLIAVFVFALPLMILEITMGRHYRGTVVSAFRALRPEFRIAGWLLVAILFLILSYYIVITGWTLAYSVFSATGSATTFSEFTGSYLPVGYGALAIVLTGMVVALGVREGIERVSVLMVPVIVILLTIMTLFCTTLSGFGEAIRFLFTPDFSVLTHAGLWVAAFGQAFFSLSVGEGILLTYGAYMAKDQDIPRASIVICIADVAVALLAGLVIFPVVFTFSLSPTAGTELAFTTLPLAFSLLPAGHLFAVAFFIVLFFAAFTSAVSMLEVAVSSVQEAAKWGRRKTAGILTAILLIVSLAPALSYSAMNLSLHGIPVLDIMDETIGTLGLHLAGAIVAIAFTWFVPRGIFEAGVGRDSSLTRAVFLLCRYVIPSVLLATIGIHLIAGFEIPDATYIAGRHFLDAWLQSGGLATFLMGILVVVLIIERIRR